MNDHVCPDCGCECGAAVEEIDGLRLQVRELRKLAARTRDVSCIRVHWGFRLCTDNPDYSPEELCAPCQARVYLRDHPEP